MPIFEGPNISHGRSATTTYAVVKAEEKFVDGRFYVFGEHFNSLPWCGSKGLRSFSRSCALSDIMSELAIRKDEGAIDEQPPGHRGAAREYGVSPFSMFLAHLADFTRSQSTESLLSASWCSFWMTSSILLSCGSIPHASRNQHHQRLERSSAENSGTPGSLSDGKISGLSQRS